MGRVDLDGDGKLAVWLESSMDAAALGAALRAVPGTDAQTVAADKTVTFDIDNAANLLAVHACRFRWTEAAMTRALDELAPYALQQVSMHSTMRLKSQQRWMAQAQEAAKRRQPGDQG